MAENSVLVLELKNIRGQNISRYMTYILAFEFVDEMDLHLTVDQIDYLEMVVNKFDNVNASQASCSKSWHRQLKKWSHTCDQPSFHLPKKRRCDSSRPPKKIQLHSGMPFSDFNSRQQSEMRVITAVATGDRKIHSKGSVRAEVAKLSQQKMSPDNQMDIDLGTDKLTVIYGNLIAFPKKSDV